MNIKRNLKTAVCQNTCTHRNTVPKHHKAAVHFFRYKLLVGTNLLQVQ